jgi:hypothetical protein
VRFSAFVAGFSAPVRGGSAPLISIFVNFDPTTESDDALVITDVPVDTPSEENQVPLTYGTDDAGSLRDCGGESIVAIEG